VPHVDRAPARILDRVARMAWLDALGVTAGFVAGARGRPAREGGGALGTPARARRAPPRPGARCSLSRPGVPGGPLLDPLAAAGTRSARGLDRSHADGAPLSRPGSRPGDRARAHVPGGHAVRMGRAEHQRDAGPSRTVARDARRAWRATR